MPRSLLLAAFAVVESIALFAVGFALAGDQSVGWALAALVGSVGLCVIALRLIDAQGFAWLRKRGAIALLALANLFLVARAIGVLANEEPSAGWCGALAGGLVVSALACWELRPAR